ncbi:MAG: nitroreductase [Flammeovirgaceae bacterium]|nr:nitroreductase [Flammeovirgaceae bacterium]MDW8286585.1 nitroreductase [Flammeovirgaceae bacterium]
MKYSVEEINHLIRHRRSVYPDQYSGREIDRQIVEQILENAIWAPTHGLTQPWQFFVFSGDKKRELAQIQADLYKKNTPVEKFSQEKYDKFFRTHALASHIIAICMKRQPSQQIPEIEEIAAVACAVQNMYLTATAYEVGAYWSTGGMTFMEEAKEFFGLSEHDRLMGFFFLGEIARPSPDSQRIPMQEKVFWL